MGRISVVVSDFRRDGFHADVLTKWPAKLQWFLFRTYDQGEGNGKSGFANLFFRLSYQKIYARPFPI